MGMINYKMQKIMLFAMAGFIPGMVFILMSVIGMNIMVNFVFMVLAAGGLTMAGHLFTSQHPFVKAIQEAKVLIIDTPSTGICNIYTASVVETDMNGIDIHMESGEVRAYDRSVTNLMTPPQRGRLSFLRNKSNPMESKVKIELSNDEYKNSAWRFDNITVLFYNSQTGTMLTKPLMSQQEKDLLAEYLSLNEARELRQLNRALLQLMRYTFDLIGDRMSKILKNPVVIMLIVMALIVVLGWAAMEFLPGLSGATDGAVTSLGGVANPLTKGAPVPFIGGI